MATLPPNETTYYFDNCTHLGYYAENSGNSFPTLGDNIFDPSLKDKNPKITTNFVCVHIHFHIANPFQGSRFKIHRDVVRGFFITEKFKQ